MDSESIKHEVYVTLDRYFDTWNVMSLTHECLFYAKTYPEVMKWLEDNSDLYIEQE